MTSFDAINLQPDVIIKNAQNKILFRHRKSEIDIYWLNNRSENPASAEVSFKISGKVPELWNPQTGTTEKVSYQFKDGRTIVPLKFESWDAFFIVFKDKAVANSFTLPAVRENQLATISGEWNISFQKDRGAPASIKVNELSSWTSHADDGVKYFSGTATYAKTITADKSWVEAGEELWLDLGEVKNLAEIIVNGKSLGIVWKQPFRLNVTGALKTGNNKVEIKVTNLWVNRLIGDQQPGVTNKITYTTMPFYQANSPLLPSGLIGPVKIYSKD